MGKRVLSTITCAATLSILSMVFVPELFGQDFKIGYVDPGSIFQRMPEVKAVQQRIQNLYERKQNEIGSKQRELQSQLEQYQQKAGVISEEARQAEGDRLTQMDLEFRQLQSDVQQEIQQKSAELMEPLFEQIQTSVSNVAKQQGIDLILNMTVGGYSVLDRNVVYVSPEYRSENNITSSVMEDLGI